MRSVYDSDAMLLIAVGQIVATEFATIASSGWHPDLSPRY
ncbi:MAG: hypothetical protein HC866_26070 [Leptolyngbyaceae cyanobacterium RU_5_1]|nr:hypothetical protein [Leptolyngbyaceae cyanobacterium RU_5_1]